MITSKWIVIAGATLVGGTAAVYQGARVPVKGAAETVIIDVAGDGVRLSSAEDGAYFDMEAKGPRLMAWTAADSDDAFLAVDENHNGRIDNGTELIGGSAGPPDGFLYLQAYDGFAPDRPIEGKMRGTPDKVIDASDSIFGDLLLWTDRNHNGKSEESELMSLAYAGYVALDLRTIERVGQADGFGSVVKRRAIARWSDGFGTRDRLMQTVSLKIAAVAK